MWLEPSVAQAVSVERVATVWQKVRGLRVVKFVLTDLTVLLACKWTRLAEVGHAELPDQGVNLCRTVEVALQRALPTTTFAASPAEVTYRGNDDDRKERHEDGSSDYPAFFASPSLIIVVIVVVGVKEGDLKRLVLRLDLLMCS